jgi:hypothetical protein
MVEPDIRKAWPCSCYPKYALGQTDDWMNDIYPLWLAARGELVSRTRHVGALAREAIAAAHPIPESPPVISASRPASVPAPR